MPRRTVPLTLDRLDAVPVPCRSCVFWELDPSLRSRAEELGDTAFEKEAWISATMLEWGACGLLAEHEGVAAGYALFAPPPLVPRARAFPTAPVSADALLLATITVLPEFRGVGLGRMLVQDVAREAVKRSFTAIEAFGDARPEAEQHAHGGCVTPAAFLAMVGFRTVRAHPVWPRMRLELRTALPWRAEVEVALERLLGSSMPGARPVAGAIRSAGAPT